MIALALSRSILNGSSRLVLMFAGGLAACGGSSDDGGSGGSGGAGGSGGTGGIAGTGKVCVQCVTDEDCTPFAGGCGAATCACDGGSCVVACDPPCNPDERCNYQANCVTRCDGDYLSGSDNACGSDWFPKCDLASGECWECKTSADCTGAQTTCWTPTHECGCTYDWQCNADPLGTKCHGGKCGCRDDSECGGAKYGESCIGSGANSMLVDRCGCRDDADCADGVYGGYFTGFGNTCGSDGLCTCSADAECTNEDVAGVCL